MKQTRGYILVETVTAMAVLSVSAVAVQQAVYTAVQARGLSQDYTTAQFLLEELVATADLEPRLASGDERSGTFDAPHERFDYTWKVEKVAVPMPALPQGLTPEQRETLERAHHGYMGRMTVEVRWYRGGQPFSVTGTTLIAPGRLWLPPTDPDA